ncbi:MAG: thioredoxin family protein [Flavobacteriales bacterium]|nr:thioredoxin family protein [Flavobacteriales bacterium]
MRKLQVFALLLILSFFGDVTGQIFNPVQWQNSFEKTSDSQYKLTFKATIEPGWHLYSQNLPSDDGPIATSFTFTESADYTRVGKVEEPKAHTEYDPNFDMDLSYFENEVVFSQLVEINKNTTVTGEIEFMVCDAEKCLPPEYIPFEFALTVDQKEVKLEPVQEEEKAAPNLEEHPEDVEKEEINTSNNLENSEIFNPVKWKYYGDKLEDGLYELTFEANIDKGWHLYSQNLPSEDGPIATSFLFDSSKTWSLEGLTKEPTAITEYDPNFEMDLNYFKDQVKFQQRVRLNGDKALVTGNFEFMVCDEEKCLPPEYLPFRFKIDENGVQVIEEEPENSELTDTEFSVKVGSVDLENPVSTCSESALDTSEDASLWNIFILGFLGGLIALLTPCVFPMIPLTVSFFTKGGSDQKKGIGKASMYGFFIFMVYILLSVPFHLLDQIDPNILNDISTGPVLNVIFFVIFIFFAFSFFGYYELTLPSSFTNKVDSASNVGGLLGIFFMALTLALVSFSCTGPILGSLLAGSITSSGGAWQLTAGMGGFGLALALPFTVFAAFPSMLKSLPKSGGWLDTVKKVLGFIELALAFKFLSNADLVKHWGLLKIEPFLIIWILIGIGLAAYLLGFLRLPHDVKGQKISLTRKILAVVSLVIVVYLASGFRYNEKTDTFTSLSLLSGLAPPAGYSWLHPNHCPQNINCYHDYEEAFKAARAQNKPVIIDFTGWACVNCRKMEENVWNDPKVFSLLNNDYILLSLYVDDKQELPEDQQFEFVSITGAKKRVKTIGNKWANLQTETFNNNSQPYYVLMSPDEKLLNRPRGYTPEIDEYLGFLNCGLDAFKSSDMQAALVK